MTLLAPALRCPGRQWQRSPEGQQGNALARAADGVAVHRHAVVERLVLEQIELKRPVEPAAVEGVEERPAGTEHGGVGEEQ